MHFQYISSKINEGALAKAYFNNIFVFVLSCKHVSIQLEGARNFSCDHLVCTLSMLEIKHQRDDILREEMATLAQSEKMKSACKNVNSGIIVKNKIDSTSIM